MLDGLTPGKILGAGMLAMAASFGAVAEAVPVAHFAAAITVLTLVHRIARASWKAWHEAEAWLDARISSAIAAGTSDSITRLEKRISLLRCQRIGLCDDTGELRQISRGTPLPTPDDS